MFKSKLGLSPVVATALLLVVAVVAVVGFQNWFGTYSTEMFVKAEKDSSQTSQTNIETLVGDQLYFKNTLDENITIKQIKLGSRECNISLNVTTGVHNISLGDCIKNLTLTDSIGDITVITDKQIYEKKHLFKDVKISSSSSQVVVPQEIYEIFFVSPTPIDNLTSSNTDYLINISLNQTNVENLTLNWNGSLETFGTGWIKTFGLASRGAESFSLIENSNQELVFTGYVNERYEDTVWKRELSLFKTDLLGNLIFFNATTGKVGNGGYDLLETANGDLIVLSVKGDGGCQPWWGSIERYNSIGSLLWSKLVYVRAYNALDGMIELSNGDIVVSGIGMDSGCGSGGGAAFLTKLDSNGNEIWTKSSGTVRGERYYDIIGTNDSNFLTIGVSKTYGGTDADMVISKFDTNGNEIWTIISDGSYDTGVINLLKYDNNSFYVLGYSNEFSSGADFDLFITKFDYNGNELWTSYVGGTGDETSQRLIKTSDGNLLVLAQTTSFGANGNDILLTKFDTNGNELWSSLISLASNDLPEDIIETSQNNLMILGKGTLTGNIDTYLINLNSQGELLGYLNYTRLDINNNSYPLTFSTLSHSFTDVAISYSNQAMTEMLSSLEFNTLFQGITKNSTHSNLLINKSGLISGFYEYNVTGYDNQSNYLNSQTRNLTIS